MTSAIQKVGQLTPNEFYNKTPEFKKIFHLDNETVSLGIAIIFTRLAVFSGLKEDIHSAIKQDIMNGIYANFNNLSLEEIEFAFSMDRDGAFGEPTQHYQFVNREYVGRVLRKYLKWIEEKKMVPNRIPIG